MKRISTVEILYQGASEWQLGPDLPEPLADHEMINLGTNHLLF